MFDHCVVSNKAQLGEQVVVGVGTVIYDNVRIGDQTVIGDHCSIGTPYDGQLDDRLLEIGHSSRIRSHTVLYEGSRFREGLEVGHHALIRERTVAGKCLRLGSFCDVEGDCSFGDYVRCHSYVHVGKASTVGSFVWLYSLVTLTNDPIPPSDVERGVVLEDGVVVCIGSTVLPGTRMATGAYAAAGTMVRGEVAPGVIVSGANCESAGHVATLADLETGLRHPWMRHFGSHYPEEAQEAIRKLGETIESSRFTKETE